MKAFIVGLWGVIVALGVVFAVVFFMGPKPPGPKTDEKASLSVEKTRVINVPMIANGAVQGFIVAQFAYTIDPKVEKKITVQPDVFLLDEAFRKIYTDDKLDFHHLDRYDVGGLTKYLVEATNKRLGAEAVHDVLVQDFSFVAKDQVMQ